MKFFYTVGFLFSVLLTFFLITPHAFAATILNQPVLTSPRPLTTHAPVVQWNTVSGATHYDVTRNGTVVATVTSPEFTDIDAAGPGKQGTKTYQVQAFDDNGNDSPLSASFDINYYWAEPQPIIPQILPQTATTITISGIFVVPTGYPLTQMRYAIDEVVVSNPPNGTTMQIAPTSDDRIYTVNAVIDTTTLSPGTHTIDIKGFMTSNGECNTQPPDGAWFPCPPEPQTEPSIESEISRDITVAATRQLTTLSPAKVWMNKALFDLGLRLDVLAEVYKDNTLVSSGQLSSVNIGSGGFNNATLLTIPFTNFSPVSFPTGSQLKMKLSARTACNGSLRNAGTARLWFNDASANSQFGASISAATNYYLRNNFALATTTGTGPRQDITVQSGTRCSAFKSFGTWTITP